MAEPPAEVLARYPAPARPQSPPLALGNAGGASGAQLWRFPTALGVLCLRAWPADGPDADGLAALHRLLAEARSLPFVPVPIAASDGRTALEGAGRVWELTPWMPGAADTTRPPSPARLRAGFAGLAALHQAWGRRRTMGPSPGLSRRLSEIDALRNSGFDALAAALDRAPAGPARDLAQTWIVRARPLAAPEADRLRRFAGEIVPLQPILRDARPDHFLFEGDRLTGLVDYGAVGIDAVSADLSRLLTEWVGPDPEARAEALAAYAPIRPLDALETALIDAFARPAALLMGNSWARWHFLEGRTFDDPGAVVEGLRRGLDRLGMLPDHAFVVVRRI